MIRKECAVVKPSPNLDRYNKPERRETNCSLGSETRFCPQILRPLQLKVVDNKPCDGPEKVDPCCRLSRLVGENVETVSSDGHCGSKLKLAEERESENTAPKT